MNEPLPPNGHEHRKLYHAYLLRLWCTEEADTGCWRASLEDLHTGERVGFPTLEELFAFLVEESELTRSAERLSEPDCEV